MSQIGYCKDFTEEQKQFNFIFENVWSFEPDFHDMKKSRNYYNRNVCLIIHLYGKTSTKRILVVEQTNKKKSITFKNV